jgi:DHA1 family tetracycline resistance protein-like MFS transporter
VSEAAPASTAGRYALGFIFITVLLDAMALGMVTPVLPRVVTELLAGFRVRPEVMAHLPVQTVSVAAVIYGLFHTVFALMQFFFSPAIGALSDRFGRRPLILASNIGLGLNYLLMAWAPTLQWLFIGRVLSGVTGASLGTASAYIADVTTPEKRTGAFGMLGAAFGFGFILGPAIGGPLGEIHPRLPFVVAAGFSLLNAAYGFFVLPESLPKALRRGFQWKRANPIGALGLLRGHPELFGLAAVAFLSNLAQVSLPTTVVLYVMHRYHWSTGQIGLTLGVVGVAVAVVQVLILGRFVRWAGDRAAMVLGLLFGVAGLLWAGLAKTGPQLWMAIPVLALWGLSGPAVQVLMTRRVAAFEQGQLQGANASLTGISELVGPIVFSLTFAYFVKPGQPMERSGAPFILGAGLLLIACGIGWWTTRRSLNPYDAAGERG